MSNPAQLKQSMRYQKWFEEVQAYNARPESMSSAEWCEANGIKPATFYCRLRKIQQLYVDSHEQTSIVPVKSVEPPAVVEPTFVELAPAQVVKQSVHLPVLHPSFVAALELKYRKIFLNSFF